MPTSHVAVPHTSSPIATAPHNSSVWCLAVRGPRIALPPLCSLLAPRAWWRLRRLLLLCAVGESKRECLIDVVLGAGSAAWRAVRMIILLHASLLSQARVGWR